MENRSHSPNETPNERISAYIDPAIISDFPYLEERLLFFQTAEQSDAQFSLHKKSDRLWVQFPDGEFSDYPYYLKNVSFVLDSVIAQKQRRPHPLDAFQSFIKAGETLERKLFSSASSEGSNIRDLWDGIIKKVNTISAESHSLKGLVERILEVPFLNNFQTSLIVLHLKGQTRAELLGTMWKGEKVSGLIEVKEFNQFFTSIKKSKIKSFSTESFLRVNLPFNGSFLAKELVSKKYSLVAVVSRHDFLPYSAEEIDLFETCIDLLQPHFERLIDQEFSDKKVSELRVCMKEFPLPLRIKDGITGSSFLNDLYRNELQDQDIFFNKKIQGPFSLDLYDSDELRHYAFDLFHFQRISLLGELLNTLRHELSNPLFGLKLSSQIFTTMEVSSDDAEIMMEIEKNVNRCQTIIENFSNLYQIQTESKPVALKKMLDESLVLSKSESREVQKKIVYGPGTEDIELNVPLIFVVQIIFNLIVNASQAMRENNERGLLQLSVRRDHSILYIDIQDNGPGIPADKINQLFKPFFTTKTQGTGLGLVLSRNLALKMGGNLEYLPDNNQKGAHFRLSLPIA